jgi:hypothetical protein
MNLVSYFSNLMSTGFSYELDDTQPHNKATVQEDGPIVAKDKKRRRNVSQDRIQRVDQVHGTYWNRIHLYFHANRKFDSDRSQGSLMNRWSGIQHDVNVFCGCLCKMEARNQSVCSIDDKVSQHSSSFHSLLHPC